MKTFLSDPERVTTSSLRVKGRLIPYEDFTARLKNYCASLGFRGLQIRHTVSFGASGEAVADLLPPVSTKDAVVILSCRVTYNPRWGGFSGLPQILVREKYDDRGEYCPASFIAPFVQQYRFAREHIYLTKTGNGRHLITVPENLLRKSEGRPGARLMIQLDKVADAAQDGSFLPVMVNGSMRSYVLSRSLQRSLDILNFCWQPERSIPIDRYLSSDLFTFVDLDESLKQSSPFCASLLPHLGEIVTHRTPNLRAAELHLRQEFANAVATFIADHGRGLGNMLCLAGLDIDMTAFEGHEEHYFVPWKAYLEKAGAGPEEHALDQDDLFVQLMQQDKQWSA